MNVVDDDVISVVSRSSGGVTAGIENTERHPHWDAFVERTPGGDVVQTSAWARIKARTGSRNRTHRGARLAPRCRRRRPTARPASPRARRRRVAAVRTRRRAGRFRRCDRSPRRVLARGGSSESIACALRATSRIRRAGNGAAAVDRLRVVRRRRRTVGDASSRHALQLGRTADSHGPACSPRHAPIHASTASRPCRHAR